MAYARKIKKGPFHIGWRVYFSHAEAEAIGDRRLKVSAILAVIVPPKVTAIIAAAGLGWKALCKVSGHKGVKAVVMVVPAPAVVLLPR